MTTAKVIDNYSIFVTWYGGSSVGWVIITFHHDDLQNKQHCCEILLIEAKKVLLNAILTKEMKQHCCEIWLIEAKKVLLYAILTKEMKNSNFFLLSTNYCENFKTSFVNDLVS